MSVKRNQLTHANSHHWLKCNAVARRCPRPFQNTSKSCRGCLVKVVLLSAPKRMGGELRNGQVSGKATMGPGQIWILCPKWEDHQNGSSKLPDIASTLALSVRTAWRSQLEPSRFTIPQASTTASATASMLQHVEIQPKLHDDAGRPAAALQTRCTFPTDGSTSIPATEARRGWCGRVMPTRGCQVLSIGWPCTSPLRQNFSGGTATTSVLFPLLHGKAPRQLAWGESERGLGIAFSKTTPCFSSLPLHQQRQTKREGSQRTRGAYPRLSIGGC